MKMNFAVAALGLATLCAGSAFADTINFSMPLGPLGHSQSYGLAPNSVTAYAFNGDGTSRDLFGKNDGGSEHGVGISGNKDNEIMSTSFVQLDLAGITDGSYKLLIGSTQLTEGFQVCFGNTLGVLGGDCQIFAMPGMDPFTTTSFSTAGNQFVSVEAYGGGQQNVLLDALVTSPVPEPSSLALLGTGIVGVAGLIRRKLAA